MKPHLKRPIPEAAPAKRDAGYTDVKMEAEYPMLHAFLCNTRWEDGTPRQTSTLLLFVEEGQMKACLNDRAGERSAFFSAATMEALLVTAEDKLLTDNIDWRVRRQPK